MKLSEELAWRGFINQYTYEDVAAIDGEPITFYWGVDPSGDSMTIGHLAPAMMIRHFMNHGHKAILLVGGATGMIGDPDGKKQERNLLTLEQIDHNKQVITNQYRGIFADKSFEIVDNYDWFREMRYLDFLREVGKNVSMTQMLDREFVKSRIGEGGDGISYAEFSYSLIQGYDFLHLYRTMGATLQVAGADQWGNSIAGAQLIRRLEGGEAHVWTTPLIINKTTGVKFGKSEAGAVWLDPAKTTPYQFFQFWLNTDDETAEDLIKIYTMLDKETVEQLIASHRENPGARALQRRLAEEVTRMVHGDERVQSVLRVTRVLFGGGNFTELGDEDIETLASEVPTVGVGKSVVDVLAEAGVVASNGEAKRLIAGGAVSVNGEKIAEDMQLDARSLVKKGKNAFVLVR